MNENARSRYGKLEYKLAYQYYRRWKSEMYTFDLTEAKRWYSWKSRESDLVKHFDYVHTMARHDFHLDGPLTVMPHVLEVVRDLNRKPTRALVESMFRARYDGSK